MNKNSIILNPPYQLYLVHFCEEMKDDTIKLWEMTGREEDLSVHIKNIHNFYYYDTVNKKWSHKTSEVKYCQWCGQKFDHNIIIDNTMHHPKEK